MKLILLNRFFYPDHSATSQILSDLAFFLSKQKHEVTVITSRLRYDDLQDHLPPFEKIHGVTVYRVWTSRFGRHFLPGRAIDYFTFYLSAAWCLFRVADKNSIVIAKTDPPLISVVAGFIVGVRKTSFVNWLQDLFPEVAIALNVRGFGGLLGKWLVKIRNSSLNHADMNIVIGERMRERLISEGVETSKIQVIHNWADGTAIKPITNENNSLREEWGLEGKFVIGYSGNLGRAHEFKTIIDAAEKLKEEGDIVFLLIGGGAQVELVKEEARKQNLNNLIFKPYQPREMLNQSLGLPDVHLVVLRPEMEGLIVPSKFYGIAAAGKPTLFIGDTQGEIAEILRSSEAGMSVGSGDGETLATNIRELKNEPDKVNFLGANARKVFEKEVDIKIALEKWKNTFLKVRGGE